MITTTQKLTFEEYLAYEIEKLFDGFLPPRLQCTHEVMTGLGISINYLIEKTETRKPCNSVAILNQLYIFRGSHLIIRHRGG